MLPYLSVGPDVLEHARNTTKRLVEVVAFFQRVLNRLSQVSILAVNMYHNCIPSAPSRTPCRAHGWSFLWR